MDRFQVVGGDRYVSCPPAIDSVRVAMEGSHTWKGSIYMYMLLWKAAILERGPYRPYTCALCMCCHGRRPYLKWVHKRVHFWHEVVTLNPVSNQTGKRHFLCVSMATSQDFHRTLVTVVHCHLLLFIFSFCSLYSCWPHFFFASEKQLEFFFLPIAQFYQSQDLCQMPISL